MFSPTTRNFLAEVSTAVIDRPNALILYGVPGIGKTSIAANIPGVVFLTDKQEDGINRLKKSGLVPATVPVMAPAVEWADATGSVEALINGDHNYRCLAIDAMGGFERLCHEHICKTHYNGDWGEHGFSSYARGYDVACADWRGFIQKLDQLRDARKMSICLLAHAKVAPFKNPTGPDYDRYAVDVHHKTWSLTHKWADLVLFANYEVQFGKGDEGRDKGRAKSIKARLLHTEQEPGFDAKNRHGLPDTIDMGNDGQSAWNNLSFFLAAANKGV